MQFYTFQKYNSANKLFDFKIPQSRFELIKILLVHVHWFSYIYMKTSLFCLTPTSEVEINVFWSSLTDSTCV